MSSTLLISLKKKQVYPQDLFESEQREHHSMVKDKLTQVHESMRDLMRSTHETFRSEVEEVQRWTGRGGGGGRGTTHSDILSIATIVYIGLGPVYRGMSTTYRAQTLETVGSDT